MVSGLAARRPEALSPKTFECCGRIYIEYRVTDLLLLATFDWNIESGGPNALTPCSALCGAWSKMPVRACYIQFRLLRGFWNGQFWYKGYWRRGKSRSKRYRNAKIGRFMKCIWQAAINKWSTQLHASIFRELKLDLSLASLSPYRFLFNRIIFTYMSHLA